jgi:hypothetical protein
MYLQRERDTGRGAVRDGSYGSQSLRRNRRRLLTANVFHRIIFVQKNYRRLMQMRGLRGKMNEPGDDKGITWLYEVSGRPIYVNLSLSIAAIEDVGFEASPARDVPYVHGLVG